MVDKIEVFTHSSIRIKDRIGNIYVDPYKMKEEPHDAAFVLITHPHYDHYSPEDILKVANEKTIMVVPESMFEDARELERNVREIIAVQQGVFKEIKGLELETLPAYNNIKPFHPKRAGWVGYVLSVDRKRIYIAGDTGVTKEAKRVKCDIALVPIGGTYTMDPKKAADLINTIRPEVAIPTHYGSIVGKESDAKNFAKMVQSPVKVVEKIQYFN